MPSAMEQALSAGGGDKPKHKTNTVSKTVFEEVKNQLAGKTTKIKRMAENAREAGLAAVNIAETQGTLFLTSMAKGAWGDDKFKVGKAPIPTLAGLGLTAWGLYDEIMGANGRHQIAIGQGLIGSDVADLGREAGAKLAEGWKKKDGDATAQNNAQTQVPANAAPTKIALSGPVRELETGRERGNSRTSEGVRALPIKVINLSDYSD